MVTGFDKDMCTLAMNGIYARSGRMFLSQELQDYYLQFDWYYPYIEPEAFTDDMLNGCQQANIATLLEYESIQGY